VGLGTYVWPVSITTPPATPIASPVSTAPMIGSIWIDSIELQIPPGHNGLTGIYVENGAAPILPYSQSPSFLVATNQTLRFDVGDQFDSSLMIVTYNLDVFPHTHYLRISGRYMVQIPQTADNSQTDIVPVS
jgi:hypothetical protein